MHGRNRLWLLSLIGAGAVTAACSSSDASNPAPTAADSGTEIADAKAGDPDASSTETGSVSPKNTDVGTCVDTFGSSLTTGFGRLDGTLVAIVRPQDQSCAMPNRDHVVLEVKMDGDVYRMVANVQSDRGNDLDVRLGQFTFPLPAPAFAEGWHSGVALDYPALGAHSDTGFDSLGKDELVTRVVGELHIGANVSVYATVGDGRPESAHLIHRNDGKADGAIVVGPESNAPSFLLFHFADQSF